MIGIVIILFLSWLLLRFVEKVNLSVLGFSPTKQSILYIIIGFSATAACCAFYHVMATALADNSFKINQSFSLQYFFKGMWWTLKSVLFEELTFRGALLYSAIKRFGIRKGCWLSAIAFGIYHWFSYGVLGNPSQMVLVFIMLTIWGQMFAYAYVKTGSLYLPTGIHFGWNLINIVVFSKGPLGLQLLTTSNHNKLQGLLSLVIFMLPIIAPPLLVYFFLRKSESAIKEAKQ